MSDFDFAGARRASHLLRALAATAAVLAGASACRSPSDLYSVDDLLAKPEKERVGIEYRYKPVNLATLRFSDIEGEQQKSGERLAYVEAAKNMEKRNRLQAHLVRFSDRICEDHKSSIVATKAVFNLIAGVANMAVGAAGALVTGGTSQVLSAVSAGITGSQAVFNDEIYHKQLAVAVTKRIDLDRDIMKAEIEVKRNNPVAVYTVDDAIGDAQRYHLKCSFHSGLASLIDEGTKPKDGKTAIATAIEARQKELESVRGQITLLEQEKKRAGLTANEKAAVQGQINAKDAYAKYLSRLIANLQRMTQ